LYCMYSSNQLVESLITTTLRSLSEPDFRFLFYQSIAL
jgi:hypothetical protein